MNRWVIGALCVALLRALSFAETVDLSLQPSVQHIAVAASGKARVAADSARSLHAYSIRIHYDPLRLRCRSVKGLQYFGSSSFLFKQVDSVNGYVQVDEALLGTGGRSGSGDLFEITFDGVTSGMTMIKFASTDLRDSANNVLAARTSDAEIQVDNVSGIGQSIPGPHGMSELVNYPNPFNLSTTIVFTGEVRGPTTLEIYSAAGQEVLRTEIGPGRGDGLRVTWDARDRQGRVVPSGMYVVRLRSNAATHVRRIVLLK